MQATRTLQQRAITQLARNAATKNRVNLIARAGVASSSTTIASDRRSLSTETLSQAEALKLLDNQRKIRPSSPHFTEPQLSWISSIANRITGSALSGGLYAFAIAYAAAPAIGLPFDGAALVSFVSTWPEWLKVSSKIVLGVPFWYHSWNGLRHLSWDMGYLLKLRESWVAGYAVIGITAVSTLATAFLV